MKRKKELTCPCCRSTVTERDAGHALKSIHKVNGIFFPHDPQEKEIDLLMLRHYHRWACDDCLLSNKAIKADPDRQPTGSLMSHDTEYLAFWDSNWIDCRDCGEPFVFSKEDQLFYYQTLRKTREARAVRCQACRKALKEQRRPALELGQMLENGELKNEADRDRVIANYRSLGREDKARYFEKRRPK